MGFWRRLFGGGSSGRSDSPLPARARARQLARRRALRTGVSPAATGRSRRRRPASENLPGAPAPGTRRAEMDRARDPGASRSWCFPHCLARARREDWQPLIRRLALLAVAAGAAGGAGGAALACKIKTDPNQAVAIEIVLPD